jgi:hypothetical protein
MALAQAVRSNPRSALTTLSLWLAELTPSGTAAILSLIDCPRVVELSVDLDTSVAAVRAHSGDRPCVRYLLRCLVQLVPTLLARRQHPLRLSISHSADAPTVAALRELEKTHPMVAVGPFPDLRPRTRLFIAAWSSAALSIAFVRAHIGHPFARSVVPLIPTVSALAGTRGGGHARIRQEVRRSAQFGVRESPLSRKPTLRTAARSQLSRANAGAESTASAPPPCRSPSNFLSPIRFIHRSARS